MNRDDAYANLLLPNRTKDAHLSNDDARLASELVGGTLRGLGTYDAIISLAARRSISDIDGTVLDALRLGAHQLLSMRVKSHAAVYETVELVRAHASQGAVGFANGVLREIERSTADEWRVRLEGELEGDARVEALTNHPAWVVRALRTALESEGREGELDALLTTNTAAPGVHLVALPHAIHRDEVVARHDDLLRPGRAAITAIELDGGDPAQLPEVRQGEVRVQDEGSQLVALALAHAQLSAAVNPNLHSHIEDSPGAAPHERWLDLCAGPGGKAALLASLAATRGAAFSANEVAPHRAELVRQALAPIAEATGFPLTVSTGDGRDISPWSAEDPASGWHRILVDAPCTGLGALRRRPEARWRKRPSDVAELAALQRDLLAAASRALVPGGVVAYVTCSPHLAETTAVVQRVCREEQLVVLDAAATIEAVSESTLDLSPKSLGGGTTVQLWPHRHGTDAMFLALLQRP